MLILVNILVYVYSVLMLISSISAYMQEVIPFILLLMNGLFAIILLFAFKSSYCFYIGMIGIFVCAMINGIVMNGTINVVHISIRIVFTVLMLYGFYQLCSHSKLK